MRELLLVARCVAISNSKFVPQFFVVKIYLQMIENEKNKQTRKIYSRAYFSENHHGKAIE